MSPDQAIKDSAEQLVRTRQPDGRFAVAGNGDMPLPQPPRRLGDVYGDHQADEQHDGQHHRDHERADLTAPS